MRGHIQHAEVQQLCVKCRAHISVQSVCTVPLHARSDALLQSICLPISAMRLSRFERCQCIEDANDVVPYGSTYASSKFTICAMVADWTCQIGLQYEQITLSV